MFVYPLFEYVNTKSYSAHTWDVKRDTRDIIIVIVAAVAAVGVVFGGMYAYSGTWPPFSVVESGSMQHSDRAELGVIDTGDMVIVRTMDKDSDIVSYVEGYVSGYSRFGEYGDVIVYRRVGDNPVIHRPIVWLEHNADGTWSAPSLKDYPHWYVKDAANVIVADPDPMNISGTLTIENVGFSNKSVDINLNPSSSLMKKSGYATMGDSVRNNKFDQTGGIINSLVSRDMILYTAGMEIPWFGSVKLLLTGKNVDQIPPNSIPNVIVCVVCFVTVLTVLFASLDWWETRRPYDEECEEPEDENESGDEEDPHPSISIGEWLREDSRRCSDEIEEPDKGE